MAVATRTPAIVGALTCQKESYRQSLVTEVVSCTEYVAPKSTQSGTKSKSKKSTDPASIGLATTTSKTWLIELADSVLFPEGGGQPTDHGTLTATSTELRSAAAIPIRNIQRHGLRCVHFSPEPLEAGTKVRQDVDFIRRWDHMQQHTGQHLLSAILDTLSLDTLSWSMAAAGEMNYLELPRKPSDEEYRHVQERCNALIRENLPISVESPGDAEAKKLPGDYDKEKGVVRFIKIGDLDYNACCGTHLKQTSHIGLILLHHTVTVRGTNCRLFFSAGDRAIKLAAESLNAMRNIAISLSSGTKPDDVQGAVQRVSEVNAELRKKEKKLLAEIAAFESARLRGVLESGKVAWSHRPTDGLDFINLVSFEIKDSLKKEHAVAVLASGELKGPGSILILGDPSRVEAIAANVKATVSTVKGGGKGEKWQGKVMEWNKGELEALQKAVEEI